MHRTMIAALFALALLAPAPVQATLLTFAFHGYIDNDPFGVFDDATFDGDYSFDSAMTRVLDTPQSGGYAGAGGLFRIRVGFTGALVPSVSGPFEADMLNITVNNDFFGPFDQYLVTGTSSADPIRLISVTFSDFTGSAFASTALPLHPPSLAAFQSVRFALFAGTVDAPVEAEGSLDSLRCVAGCSLPEPGMGALAAAAVMSLVLARRRRAP